MTLKKQSLDDLAVDDSEMVKGAAKGLVSDALKGVDEQVEKLEADESNQKAKLQARLAAKKKKALMEKKAAAAQSLLLNS